MFSLKLNRFALWFQSDGESEEAAMDTTEGINQFIAHVPVPSQKEVRETQAFSALKVWLHVFQIHAPNPS